MGLADTLRPRGKVASVPVEELRLIEDRVHRVFGLRLQTARLDEGQQARLRDLIRRAIPEDRIGSGGLNLEQLDKSEHREFERLVEQGSGLEKGALEQGRQEAEARAKIAELARRALMPAPRPCLEEEGSIRLPQSVFENLDRKSPIYWINHLGLLVFFLAQLENAKALTPNGRIERDENGDVVLVIDPQLGLGTKYDGDGRMGGWLRDLDHLAVNKWFVVRRNGPRELRIKRGPRALAAGKPPKRKGKS